MAKFLFRYDCSSVMKALVQVKTEIQKQVGGMQYDATSKNKYGFSLHRQYTNQRLKKKIIMHSAVISKTSNAAHVQKATLVSVESHVCCFRGNKAAF